MRLRALLLGIIGALFICGFAFFNASIIRQTRLIGTFMPAIIFGLIVVFLLILNPLYRRFTGRIPLTGRDLSVFAALCLMVCFIPGYNFAFHLPAALMAPFHQEKTYPGWREFGLVEMVPKALTPDLSRDSDISLAGLMTGLAEGSENIAISEVPWHAWARPLLGFWLPAFLALNLAAFGLALVMHRQWSHHEQIAYPIAAFAQMLFPEEGRARGGVLKNRLFWIGFLAVFLIHMNNYGYTLKPDVFVPVKRQFDFQALVPLFPAFERGNGSWMMSPFLYFTAVALAYFVATDISFSMGIIPFVYATVAGVIIGFGTSATTTSYSYISATPGNMMLSGGFFGIFLFVLFAGRHHYWTVFRRGVGLHPPQATRIYEIWGFRLFLAAIGLFCGLLVIVAQVPVYLAVLYAFFSIVILVVMGRVVAETGVLCMNVCVFPSAIILTFLGTQVIRPDVTLTILVITAVLMICTREMSMPFFMHGLQMLDANRIRLGRAAVVSVIVIIAGVAVAIPVTLYWQYDRSLPGTAGFWAEWVARMPYEESLRLQQNLHSQGMLEEAGTQTGLDFLRDITPEPRNSFAFLFAMGMVLLLYWGRMRFSWWPLHPVMFAVLFHWQSTMLAFSILLGCAIKILVTKYGGAHGYQRVKPLMVGLIAGDMLGGLVPAACGALYYLVTGERPFVFQVFPNIS